MSNLKVENLIYQDWSPMNFSVAAGECAFLHGASGAGKTLLLRSLADLVPHKGKIFLDEKECHLFTGPQWRKNVALLPPDPLWWHPTVGEHFPKANTSIIHQLGFQKDVLHWDIHRLSMGEKKRLAIARLFIHSPKSLLLDEPTANLDAANVEKVETLLLDYKKNHQTSLLWVSHDKEQMQRLGDTVYYMENKTLIKENS